jgi:hypothetical protein
MEVWAKYKSLLESYCKIRFMDVTRIEYEGELRREPFA